MYAPGDINDIAVYLGTILNLAKEHRGIVKRRVHRVSRQVMRIIASGREGIQEFWIIYTRHFGKGGIQRADRFLMLLNILEIHTMLLFL